MVGIVTVFVVAAGVMMSRQERRRQADMRLAASK
jgi:hypothetical protein